MVHEKSVLLVLVFVMGAVLLLSFNPGFTGYSVSEGHSLEVVASNVLPGETTKVELPLQVNTDSLSYGKVLATGEAASWISFPSENYAFLPDLETDIPLYITVPEGTEVGNYDAKIALLSEDSEEGSLMQDSIISYIPVTIEVGSEANAVAFGVHSFTVYDAEYSGDIYFHAVLENLANTGQKPDVTLQIYDSKGALVLERSFHPIFVAYEKKDLRSSLSQTLDTGKYYAKILVGKESMSTSFEVVDDGDLKQKGELLYLETSVEDDSLVTVTAYFKNTGEDVVYASLAGTVKSNEEVVEEIQTEPQTILPGEYGIFRYSYSELLSGVYTLDAELTSDNVVLAEDTREFYSSDAISLESNVVVIISLVMLLLIVSHFMLSRRKE